MRTKDCILAGFTYLFDVSIKNRLDFRTVSLESNLDFVVGGTGSGLLCKICNAASPMIRNVTLNNRIRALCFKSKERRIILNCLVNLNAIIRGTPSELV